MVVCVSQLAVLAEFQQDWTSAVKHYQSAYVDLLDVPVGNPVNLQRLHEATIVAERIHLKMVTILFHQQRREEGMRQFAIHIAKFKRTPGKFSMASCCSNDITK